MFGKTKCWIGRVYLWKCITFVVNWIRKLLFCQNDGKMNEVRIFSIFALFVVYFGIARSTFCNRFWINNILENILEETFFRMSFCIKSLYLHLKMYHNSTKNTWFLFWQCKFLLPRVDENEKENENQIFPAIDTTFSCEWFYNSLSVWARKSTWFSSIS